MIICEVCKENIKNYATFWRHLKIHNLTTKDYYDKFLKKENEGICLRCGKETNFINIHSGYDIKFYINYVKEKYGSSYIDKYKIY